MAMETVLPLLKQYWGYDSFRPLQEEAVASAMAGRDSLVVLPTGGGKSLCFQAPALAMDGLAVVVSPLIALMKDQVDNLRECGVPAACIHSMLTDAERRATADAIRARQVKLLYVSPERIVQPRFASWLRDAGPISFVAVDEAHCISMWGHDFRPEYRALQDLKQAFPGIAVHAYTATATPHVRDDIVSALRLERPEVLVGSFDRPNLVYSANRRTDALGQIREVVDRHPDAPGIVYCISRKQVEQTCEALCGLGFSALPYHAGLPDLARKENQERFVRDEARIIVATVAFGMGIDKPDVRYVVHAGMPKSIEHYQQESGRAGRDGLEAECLLLYSGGDFGLWKSILTKEDENGEAPSREATDVAVRKLGDMYEYCTGVGCRHRRLSAYFGQELAGDDCGACDFCLDTLEVMEGAEDVARHVLEAVQGVNNSFGAAYVTRVLRGVPDERTERNGHDRLEVFGALRDYAQNAVRDWVEQLVGQGLLVRVGEYAVLEVTPAGMDLLRGSGEQAPKLLKPATAQQTRKKLGKAAARSMEGVDPGLFDALRTLRQGLARERNVPAYVVFGDATLQDMARMRPRNEEELLLVRGVGKRKSEQYGEVFLKAIAEYALAHSLDMGVGSEDAAEPPPSVDEDPWEEQEAAPPEGSWETASTAPPKKKQDRQKAKQQAFELFAHGYSREEVGETVQRAEGTVWGYLQEYVREEQVTDASPWVAPELEERILAARDANEGGLKAVYEALDGEVSYEDIRLVLLCRDNQRRAEAPSPAPESPVELDADPGMAAAGERFAQGASVEEVASEAGRDLGWAYQALAAYIAEAGITSPFQWVDHGTYLAIAMAAGQAESTDLRRVMTRLGAEAKEGEVRVALACLRNRS